MNEPDVLTVYTTPRCGDCDAAKRALTSLGVPFREVRLDERPDAIDFVLAVNEGRRSVPTLHYRGHAASLSRFDRRRLDAFLDRSGAHPSPPRHDRPERHD